MLSAPRRAIAVARRAAGSAPGSLFRLTPSGDAARLWLPSAMALLIVAFAFSATQGSLRFVLTLVATNVLYGLFLTLTWRAMWLSTPADVRAWAVAQETPGSRWRRFLEEIRGTKVFSGGSGMSLILSFCLGGLFLALELLPRGEALATEPLLTLLCVLGVLLSWALLHTSFAMYYAHLHYRDPRGPGGLGFPGEEEPAAPDFAYFAFTIGTAFATSDVSVRSARFRRTVLLHSVLAFFYNTTILALVINLVIGSV